MLSRLPRFHGAPPTAPPPCPRGLRGFTAGLVSLPGVWLVGCFVLCWLIDVSVLKGELSALGETVE